MRTTAGINFLLIFALLNYVPDIAAQEIFRDTSHTLLRSGNTVEWDEFAGVTSQQEKKIRFNIHTAGEHTISFVQYDVKQNWRLQLNDQDISLLPVDGNTMRVYFDLPVHQLKIGENIIKINQTEKVADDIVISDLVIVKGSMKSLLSKGSVSVQTIENGQSLPVRYTVADQNGILQTTGTLTSQNLVIRPGMIYSADGKALLLLPEGKFKIYATRGFEYGVDSITVRIKRGNRRKFFFNLKREVDTEGWVSMDPHIHTLTYSGHGDVSATERVISIAGEGLDVAVVTEHNKIVDYSNLVRQLHLENFYTMISGDEVTTAIGHFNILPLDSSMDLPEFRAKNWLELNENFKEYHSPLIILNHGRDIHQEFRPFGFLDNIENDKISLWPMPANAMEIINSGALLTDPMLLVNDWFNLLKRGEKITPIGASDSHDAARYLVGQAKTYIQTDDRYPGKINVPHLLHQLKEGKVSVSFGLMTEIEVSEKTGTPQAGSSKDKIKIKVIVKGPGWMNADKVELYANGNKIEEAQIIHKTMAGIKFQMEWELEKPALKTFYVAIASGEYHPVPFWPVVKPFQPVSTSWKPYVMGISGAVWMEKSTK